MRLTYIHSPGKTSETAETGSNGWLCVGRQHGAAQRSALISTALLI
jgi:hypothetical protein